MDLVIFTEGILSGKLHFLCSDKSQYLVQMWENTNKKNSSNSNTFYVVLEIVEIRRNDMRMERELKDILIEKWYQMIQLLG